MSISIVVTEIDVIEGECDVRLILKKTEGAIGPVSVRIYTEEGTAIGMMRCDVEDEVIVTHTLPCMTLCYFRWYRLHWCQ